MIIKSNANNTIIRSGAYLWIIPLEDLGYVQGILEEFVQIYRELKYEFADINVIISCSCLGDENCPKTFFEFVGEVTWNIYIIQDYRFNAD
jgi:hypothetical protein